MPYAASNSYIIYIYIYIYKEVCVSVGMYVCTIILAKMWADFSEISHNDKL